MLFRFHRVHHCHREDSCQDVYLGGSCAAVATAAMTKLSAAMVKVARVQTCQLECAVEAGRSHNIRRQKLRVVPDPLPAWTVEFQLCPVLHQGMLREGQPTGSDLRTARTLRVLGLLLHSRSSPSRPSLPTRPTALRSGLRLDIPRLCDSYRRQCRTTKHANADHLPVPPMQVQKPNHTASVLGVCTSNQLLGVSQSSCRRATSSQHLLHHPRCRH